MLGWLRQSTQVEADVVSFFSSSRLVYWLLTSAKQTMRAQLTEANALPTRVETECRHKNGR